MVIRCDICFNTSLTSTFGNSDINHRLYFSSIDFVAFNYKLPFQKHCTMSEHAWKMSPKFQRHHNKPMLAAVPEGFKVFLSEKVNPVKTSGDEEQDVMIRKVLALWRLCWFNVPDGFHLIDKRLREVVGNDWQEGFEERNGKVIQA